MRAYGLIFAFLGGMAALWYVGALRADIAAQRDAMARTVAALSQAQAETAQARDSIKVLTAHMERLEATARRYDEIREWVAGRDDDAPIPPLLRDALDRLFAARPR